MSMDVEDAICLVMTLQYRAQTNMTSLERELYQRALRVVDACASRRIEAERAALPSDHLGKPLT